jgi:hypothetical protein
MPILKKDKDKEIKVTGSNERIWEILMRTEKKKSFKKDIYNLRKEFGIPERGYEELPTDFDTFGYRSFSFPKEWREKITGEVFVDFSNKLNEIIDKYQLGTLKSFPYVFYWIVLYGKCALPCDIGEVVLEDMVKAKREIKFNKPMENYHYPVALLISSYASGKEIKDFVNKHLNRIKMYQNRYKKQAPPRQSIRLREPLEITRIIYSLDGKKSPKEISDILAEKMGRRIYNNDDITRILDKKRRKEK